MKAAIDDMQMSDDGHVPIKLYLQKQVEGQIRPTGYSLPTPGLDKCKILSLGPNPAALGWLKKRRLNRSGPHSVHHETAMYVAAS